MKNIKLFILTIMFIFTNSINIFAITDTKIFTDTISNTYQGTENGKATIANLKFTDLNGHWAKEAVTKAGAFNMVKGYDKKYSPNSPVSNQEALAFVLRAIGMEQAAQDEGENLKAQAPNDEVLSIWSIGYLSLARNIGLINNNQFTEATTIDQQILPDGSFKRGANATREQVATWIVSAINYIGPENLISDEQQSIYNYSDWKNIASEHIEGVEVTLDNGIMKGTNGKFNPKGYVTRAEMAQILTNLDQIYNNITGHTKKNGTVAGIKDNQTNLTGQAFLERSIYIRTADGKVDVLQYLIESSDSPQAINRDAVVYNIDSVTGLSGLREGSQIEYIVDDALKTIKYVGVKDKTINSKDVFGVLTKINYDDGIVQITDKKGKTFNYYSTDGLIGTEAAGSIKFAFIDNKKITQNSIPFGEWVNLETKNNIVTKIKYVGTPNLQKELRGIVIENNPQFSYLTVRDNKGNEVTKNYFSDDITVEKQPYYSEADDIGYLDQMFPNFDYDPRDTTIDKIEPGDVVFITSKEDDPSQIDKISASPNYIMRYGKVTQISKGINTTSLTFQLENGQISNYEISNDIFVSKSGKPSNISDVMTGDWLKLLVNEAILAPGETIESVKEVVVEDSGHNIGDIIKGEIGKIDTIQKEISITNSYVLNKSGWDDFKQVRKLSLANNDIEYYQDGKRVDLNFVNKYLKRNGQVYIALEENYAGNLISKITFRNGRDQDLQPAIITNSNNLDTFSTATSGLLQADAGTIIRKNGKLIDASSVSTNDYARILLNGEGKPAIVDIYEPPVNDSINIARGRVLSIDEGKSFTVESISQLSGNDWIYSPINRKFTIDGNTLFISESGIDTIDKFLGYGQDTKIGKAYTIVYEGGKATHIIDVPHSTQVVSGNVITTTGDLIIKDAKFKNPKGAWEVVGVKDSSLKLKSATNTIVIKGNKLVPVSSLQKGDLVRVLTDNLPEKVNGGTEINARIIFVGN